MIDRYYIKNRCYVRGESRPIPVGRRSLGVTTCFVCHYGWLVWSSCFGQDPGHSYHMFASQESEQLVGEATVQDSVISRCQINKHGTSFSFCFKTVLNVLSQQNCLIPGWSPTLKSSLLNREQSVNNGFDTGVDKPFEDLIKDKAIEREFFGFLWILRTLGLRLFCCRHCVFWDGASRKRGSYVTKTLRKFWHWWSAPGI